MILIDLNEGREASIWPLFTPQRGPQHFQARPASTHSSDKACACLHGAEACVANLDGQNLSPGGDTVPLRLFWEMPGGNAGHMGTVSSWVEKGTMTRCTHRDRALQTR